MMPYHKIMTQGYEYMAICCDMMPSSPVAVTGEHSGRHSRGLPHQALAYLRPVRQVCATWVELTSGNKDIYRKAGLSFVYFYNFFFRFSFASKTFRPEQERKASQSPARTIGQETTSLVC